MKKISITRGYNTHINGFILPSNAIYGRIKNTYFYTTDHARIENDRKLFFTVYTANINSNKPRFFSNDIKKDSEIGILVCDFSISNVKHGTRSINPLYNQNYNNLMKHPRKHKRSSGGQIEHKHSITDYECTKNPLHDFRRTFY